MKKTILFLAIAICALTTKSQVPSAFNYQAVLRDATGKIISDSELSLRISILQDFETGNTVYSEMHTIKTNNIGLVNLVIGDGTKLAGTFSPEGWGNDKHFLKVEINPDGKSFIQMGISQLLSVPYAFHAQTVENDKVDDADNSPSNEIQTISLAGNELQLSKSGGTVTLPESNGDDLGDHTLTDNLKTNGKWISGDGDEEGILVGDDGNVGIGTTNPAFLLDVFGKNYKVRYNSGGNVDVLLNRASNRNYANVQYASDDTALWAIGLRGVNAADGLFFHDEDAGKTRMMIDGTSGNVGIGTTNPLAALTAIASGVAVFGESSNSSGVYGKTNAAVHAGVHGKHEEANNIGKLGTNDAGVFGIHGNNGNSGKLGTPDYGVYGESFNAIGVYGTTNANDGAGVHGINLESENYGFLGHQEAGVVGFAEEINSSGMFGLHEQGNYGQLATRFSGVYGSASSSVSNAYAVHGQHSGSHNEGRLGTSDEGVYGQHGFSGNHGILGTSLYGVYGETQAANGSGMKGIHIDKGNSGRLGTNSDGVIGQSKINSGSGVAGIHSGSGNGVYGRSSSGYAGFFQGKVKVTGKLEKGSGSFKIDHPLDPAEKYLSHSFVESPDMMNIYNGNVKLDTKGEATVEMPEWFDALNMEFRYQLTCIGGYANVYISEELKNNHFKIAGGNPGLKVSWMLTGIRKDKYAEMNPILVEEDKEGTEKGKYLHPEAFGLPPEMGRLTLN